MIERQRTKIEAQHDPRQAIETPNLDEAGSIPARAANPSWKGEPFAHQVGTYAFHQQRPYSIDTSEVGVGKTAPVIMTLWQAIMAGKVLKPLVVCPNSITDNWVREIEMWSDLHPVVLRGTKDKRKMALCIYELDKDAVYIINYEGVRTMTHELVRAGFDGIICDEAHHLKNSRAKQTKAVLLLSSKCRWRKALTGTPILNNLEDLWAIYEFVDPNIIPHNFWGFRNTYLYNTNAARPWVNWPDWQPKPGALEKIKALTNPVTIYHSKKEVLPFLPPVLFETRKITISGEQEKVYKELKKDFLTQLANGEILAVPHILSRLGKLLQVTGGFVYMPDNPNAYLFSNNAKLNELMDVLDELGDKQVIIWANFREEIDLIERALRAKGFSPLVLKREVPSEERLPIIAAFHEGISQYIIASPTLISEGVTILAPYIISYSRSWKLKDRIQSLGRSDRPGSEQFDNITVIDLLVPDTFDETVMQSLDRKEDLLQNFRIETVRGMV